MATANNPGYYPSPGIGPMPVPPHPLAEDTNAPPPVEPPPDPVTVEITSFEASGTNFIVTMSEADLAKMFPGLRLTFEQTGGEPVATFDDGIAAFMQTSGPTSAMFFQMDLTGENLEGVTAIGHQYIFVPATA